MTEIINAEFEVNENVEVEDIRTNKELFVDMFEAAMADENISYIALFISGVDPVPETILVPRENFESKLEYIKEKYDDDLAMNFNPDIFICESDAFGSVFFSREPSIMNYEIMDEEDGQMSFDDFDVELVEESPAE